MEMTDTCGSGPGGGKDEAQWRFTDFTVELLRLLSGGGTAYIATESLKRFIDHCVATKVPLGSAIDGAVTELNKAAFDRTGRGEYELDEVAVIHASLKVLIEDVSGDNMARARRSKRAEDLHRCIEAVIVSGERKSRENGWSYVGKMTERLGKWHGGRK